MGEVHAIMLPDIEIKRLVKFGIPLSEARRSSLGDFLEFWKWHHRLNHSEDYRLIYPYDYQVDPISSQAKRLTAPK